MAWAISQPITPCPWYWYHRKLGRLDLFILSLILRNASQDQAFRNIKSLFVGPATPTSMNWHRLLVHKFKVAVARIALIAIFALPHSWSQAIHDDPYKVYISEQVCVWSMCWHQRSPPFSNMWGCYSHQHGRGIKIKN